MGIIQNLTQVREVLQDVGNTVGSTAGAFGKAAGKYVCGLYAQYPTWMTGENVDAPGLLSSIRKSFLNEVCGTPPTLPPTPPPFEGGQCEDCYNVEISWSDLYNPADVGVVGSKIIGPIGGIRAVNAPGGGYKIQVLSRGSCFNSFDPVPQQWLTFVSGSPPHSVTNVALKNNGITSGAPDNCGSLPPTPPPDTPDPQDFIQNYDIDVVNNEAPTIDVTIPFAFVNLSPKLDNTFNFDLTLKDGDQEFTLDFGPEGVGGPSSPPPPSSDPKVFDRFDNLDDKTDIIIDKTNECCANSNPVEPPDKFDVVDKEPEDPKEETDIELLAYVEVLLTKKPKNAKGQFGGGTGPDVVYAGWFEFKRGTYSFPRSPLHFGSSVFKAPIGADGYAYTLYVGFEGKHTVYKFKKDEI